MTLHPIEPLEQYLTTTDYASHVGVSTRTVKRWLEADEIPGAEKIGTRWQIPAHAIRIQRIEPTQGTVTLEGRGTLAPSPLGTLGTLEDAAEILGTTIGGIRRLGRDGILTIGPYGPNGALRVWVRP